MTSEQRILNGRFRLLYTLGAGGMASVWLAEDQMLERPVALKELAPRNGGDDLEARRERALQEARALARIRHPAIVPVHDVFFTDDDPWIVMEYIKGQSLKVLIDRHPLHDETIARIGLHVLRGLAAVHQADIVHRDIKPDNILVADDGSIFLVDFGIARIAGDKSLTSLNSVVGTPEYVAPERLQPGRRVGPPADLWSLGVTFYCAIEGTSPFRRDSEHGYQATTHAILHEAPRPPARPSRLTDLILRLLHKDPDKRADADEVSGTRSAAGGRQRGHQGPYVDPGPDGAPAVRADRTHGQRSRLALAGSGAGYARSGRCPASSGIRPGPPGARPARPARHISPESSARQVGIA